ncbi:MAG: amino acid adenylation domain-containing protein, partial [Thermoanaerobaculia bacterium]
WFLAQLAPRSPAYNMSFAVRLTGALDPIALAAALSEIRRRHETLRTAFRTDPSGRPVQVVQPAEPLPLPLVDLSGLPEASGEARRLASSIAPAPFDLERGPLVRALLFRLASDEHAVLWVTHHIAADAWSMTAVLLPELGALYSAFAQGRPSPLPEPPVQYADFAVWQRSWLRGEVLDEQIGYWRHALDGAPTLELPVDRPRRPVPSSRGAARTWILPAGPAGRLRDLARARGATLFMAVHAAFSALLQRYTGQDDVVVGMPVAQRTRREVEGLIGFFVNTLVLRTDLSGEPDFPAAIDRSRAAALGAFAHQDLPFERLVDELGLARDPHRPPLLRVLLQLQNAPSANLELPGVRLEPFTLEISTSRFELVVNVSETAEGLKAVFTYDADLFEGATLARLVHHFDALLAAWIADPGRPASDLDLLSEAERHQLAVEWNEGLAVERERRCLHRRFEEQADRAPQAPALSAGGEQLTYRELDERANRLAHHLLARGAGPGGRVALALERSADLVVAILAVLKTGAAYVPLDPAWPAERLAFALEDSGAALLVTPGDLAGLASRSSSRPVLAADPALPAYVLYTSGSTGRPKGVVVSHANVDRLFTATGPWFAFGPDDVWTLFHSYAFDFSVWEMWGALLHGGRLVVVPYEESRSPEAFYRLLREERVTVLNQTPSAFRQLLWVEEAVLGDAPPDLALRWVIFGGEALDPACLAPWFGRHGDERPTLVNMYGITETTVHVTFRPLRRSDLGRGSVLGRPLPDLQVHVLDRHLRPQPIGVPGEICVSGAGLSQGYHGRPDLTAERFLPWPGARLYRSGDLARRLPDGDLEYLGRIDDQVKIRGFRIEPGEIAAALAGHPGVRESAVLARERRLVAYVVPDGKLDPSELRAHLAARLPDFMVPSAFVFLPELPLTPNGKVDRRALPPPEAPRREIVPPRTDLERFLAGQFRDVLGLPAEREVGIHDDFFELGGSSITGAILIHRLQEALGGILHVVAIFDHPTVASLAAHLGEAEDTA